MGPRMNLGKRECASAQTHEAARAQANVRVPSRPSITTMTSPANTTPTFEPAENSAPGTSPNQQLVEDTPLTNAELVQLRIRVIALENLVIALLAEAPDRQLTIARDMATYISPRAGFTPHPITLRAADEMLSLVDRADRYPRP